MKLKLVTTENPKKVPEILREKSKKIKEITPDLFDLSSDMLKIMKKNKGIGLAAIQVGIPIRMIVISLDDSDYTFINPEIVSFSKKEVVYNEGCLSFPEIFEDVSRPEIVKVRATNLNGKKIEIDADGIGARVLQHEIDHLEGVVFVDRIKN